jgi:predicted regulator of Ras-like GTPase activity (Roadblock/LC7/MglB family)
VDAAQALADLSEISAQIEAAVIVGEDGAPLGSTLADEERAAALARAAVDLLQEAGDAVTHVGATTRDGSVFAIREGARIVAAVTPVTAPPGLVLYDLRTCLRRLAEADTAKPKPRRTRKKKADDEEA